MRILPWRRKRYPVVELRGVIAARPGALNLQSVSVALEKGFALAPSFAFRNTYYGSSVQNSQVVGAQAAYRYRFKAANAAVVLYVNAGKVTDSIGNIKGA